MKYNKDLFELGKYYSSIEREEKKDYVIENTKKRLLTILEERLGFIMTSCEEVDDLIKLEFKSNLFGKDDEGYNEIKILLKYNAFDSFARDYCIYLKEAHIRYNESTAYIILVWDYKTYYESLEKMSSLKLKPREGK